MVRIHNPPVVGRNLAKDTARNGTIFQTSTVSEVFTLFDSTGLVLERMTKLLEQSNLLKIQSIFQQAFRIFKKDATNRLEKTRIGMTIQSW